MLAREEIFGPVLSIITVGSLEEAIAVANDTDYGLTASVFSANGKKALRAARARAIGEKLACADIVFLNESSSDRLRARLINAMEASQPSCPGKTPAIPGMAGERFFAVVDGPDLPGSRSLLGYPAGLLSGERLLDDEPWPARCCAGEGR